MKIPYSIDKSTKMFYDIPIWRLYFSSLPMNDLNTYLEELGLSEREIKIYLVALELGESYIFPIARKAAIPRTSAVYLLEKLKDRGLITILQKNSRHLYAPVAPSKIATLLKNKRTKLDEQINVFELSLPNLNRLYSSKPFATQVRFFRGRDEVRKMYDEMLTYPINEIVYTGEVDKMEAALGQQWLRGWIKRRIEVKIQTRGVRVRHLEIEDDLYGSSPKLMRKIRFAPPGFTSPSNILIYGDNVTIMNSEKESFGVVITSRDFATSMKSWFKQIWDNSTDK